MSWSQCFDEPIPIVGGRALITLKDAVRHLSETVPKSERDHPKVQNAATSLANAADGRDFVMHARIVVVQALKRNDGPRAFNPDRKDHQAKEGPMTVWIYVNTSRDVGDAEHLKVFANEAAAEARFRENDAEGVDFSYEVIGDRNEPHGPQNEANE